jgi:hypothetical protein
MLSYLIGLLVITSSVEKGLDRVIPYSLICFYLLQKVLIKYSLRVRLARGGIAKS